MAELINLRHQRKRKQREEKEKRAKEQRALHCQPKAERRQREAQDRLEARRLEGLQLIRKEGEASPRQAAGDSYNEEDERKP